ncbi:cell division protein SepF [uncultured Eubacterium sp.]|uniref:cell division protein SepF n=1 Tax=uncultured Eubacterium sp. TaxID=165185 RepID=UPI002671060F|nr:cell division protein SepF [uncultured Eubacterium sp.]
MSKFGDKFKNIFTVDYEDDYEDDYYDDYEEDIVEENESIGRKRRGESVVREETPLSQSTTSNRSRNTRATSQVKNSRSSRNSKVVPMRSSNDMEVCVMKPTHYEETKDIINTLLEGKSVVLNLEGMKLDLAQRIVDSVSGGCYAIQGNLQKISGYIYLVTPSSVDITGDFQDTISERTADYSSSAYESRRNYYGE